jgi:hypothetical protein
MNREIVSQSAVHQLFWALIDAVPTFLSFALASATLVLGSAHNALGNHNNDLLYTGGKVTSANYSDLARVHDLALWLPSLCVYPTL